MRSVMFFICFVLLLSGVVAAQVPAKRIPAFSFMDTSGKAFNNKSLKAGVFHFFVFFDISCDHCQKALTYIDQHHSDFKTTSVYLVTLDKPDMVKRFMVNNQIGLTGKANVDLLFDQRNEFIRIFGPRKYPSLFLYSRDQDLLLYDDNEQKLSMFVEKTRPKK